MLFPLLRIVAIETRGKVSDKCALKCITEKESFSLPEKMYDSVCVYVNVQVNILNLHFIDCFINIPAL